MLIEPKKIELKNGLSIILQSPEPSDAYRLLQHLKIVFGESYMNMNHPANYWDHFPIADEEKLLTDFVTCRTHGTRVQ